MAINVIIKDPKWNEVWQFTAEDGKEVVKWDAFNSPLMPLKNDENWNPEEVLACIAGFNPEKFNDGQDHIVVLQRAY